MVTVALQLPESEAGGTPNGRILDKFPSTTTVWFILRKFEAGVAGPTSIRNLTARGVPVTSGDTGAGRLFYETPVVQIMERELSSFTDLQKSLAQLGFNNGNVLLRLSFRRTEEPLEVAMVKIQDYFKAFGDDDAPVKQEPPAQQTQRTEESTQAENHQPTPTADLTSDTAVAFEQPSEQPTENQPDPSPPATESSELPTDSSRSITVFAPPSNDTPQSAQTSYNDNDFVPSVEHAKAHQHRLNIASQNKKLPSDAEIAAKAAAAEEKLAAVQEVDVKVRLPDQSQVVAKFKQGDTGRTLYDFVRNCLAGPFVSEKFILTHLPAGPPGTGGRKIQSVIPDSDKSLLIKDLGMTGRVLVNFSWDANASSAARQSRAELLKPELQNKAQQHKIEQPPEAMDTSEDIVQPKSDASRQSGEKPARKPGSLPKWLKLPGKK